MKEKYILIHANGNTSNCYNNLKVVTDDAIAEVKAGDSKEITIYKIVPIRIISNEITVKPFKKDR